MILVIGATSFIGVYTVDALLSAGKKVVVTGRSTRMKKYYEDKGVEYIEFDLSNQEDYEKLPTNGIESVILLAGLLPANAVVDLTIDDNAYDYIKINTLGTAYLLEYCRLNKINKLISTTSYADVFSSWKKDVAIDDDQTRGYVLSGDHAAYVVSKNAASDLMVYYNNQHGMSNMIFRLPPVYGVGPHGSIFVNGHLEKSGLQVFIDKAVEGAPIDIYGDGSLSRDVVYVKDVAKAFSLAVSSEKAKGMYNMTSGVAVTLKEQVETIVELFSAASNKSEIRYNKDKINTSHSYLFSIEKARIDFGYYPKYAEFKDMMSDYKNELDKGNYIKIFS